MHKHSRFIRNITSGHWTVYKINARLFSLFRQRLRDERIYRAAIDQQSVSFCWTESTKRNRKRPERFLLKDNLLDKFRECSRDKAATYLP